MSYAYGHLNFFTFAKKAYRLSKHHSPVTLSPYIFSTFFDKLPHIGSTVGFLTDYS